MSQEMGVRYVLEGSVHKAGEQVRITAQLIDGPSGGHVWSERYDRPLKDIFAVQDEIVQQTRDDAAGRDARGRIGAGAAHPHDNLDGL